MNPIISMDYFPHSCWCDSKLSGDGNTRDYVSKSPYFYYIGLGYLGLGIFRALSYAFRFIFGAVVFSARNPFWKFSSPMIITRRALSPILGNHVSHIVLSGSFKKMVNIAAKSIVTMMAYLHSICNFLMFYEPRNPMGGDHSSAPPKHTISFSVLGFFPCPTISRIFEIIRRWNSLIYIRVKKLLFCVESLKIMIASRGNKYRTIFSSHNESFSLWVSGVLEASYFPNAELFSSSSQINAI